MKTKIAFAITLFILLAGSSPLLAQDSSTTNPAVKTSQERVPPPDFVPVEKEPRIVKSVVPYYPELAQKAGIEGRVILKIWVDADGKPHQATILRSDNSIFDKPAVEAAMKYRFTPAILDNKPVAVWVVIPFTFKLKKYSSEAVNSSLAVQKEPTVGTGPGLSSSRQAQLVRLVSLYNEGMKYERLKEYSRAGQSYQAFLDGSREAGIVFNEMARHAKMIVEEYGKAQQKEK